MKTFTRLCLNALITTFTCLALAHTPAANATSADLDAVPNTGTQSDGDTMGGGGKGGG